MLPKANSFNPKLTPGFKCYLLVASYRQKKWHTEVKDLIQGYTTCKWWD